MYKNDFTVSRMSHPMDVTQFVHSILSLHDKNTIDIGFSATRIHPTACVPIAGIIQQLRASGKKIYCHYDRDSYLAAINFDRPYRVVEHLDSLAFPFSKVWKFCNFEEITKLVNAYLNEIISLTQCSAGVIEGLEWALNEVMDNVIQHSLCAEGYIMAVYHKTTNYLLFDIYDNGQGIYNSLRNSEYHPHTAIDAISIAIQEGKTRDKSIGQGNGLWGLYNIIQKNKGRLCITSSGSAIMLKSDGRLNKFEELPLLETKNGTTSVDISFNCNEAISIKEALGNHVPYDFKFQALIDEKNIIQFKLKNETTGFGTRVAGERLRNKVINHLTRDNSPHRIEIDFSNISVISSSFADEFVGKLVIELGFYNFNNMVKISNINTTIEAILNRSIYQRMAEVFNK